MKAQYNEKFTKALDSIKEHIKGKHLSNATIENFFNYDNHETTKEWLKQNVPNINTDLLFNDEKRYDQDAIDEYTKLKAINYFFYYAINSTIDRKYKTECFLINGTFNIMENPYFMDLVEYYELNNIVITTEAKCNNVIAFLNHGYTATRCNIDLVSTWGLELNMYGEHIYGTAILLQK